MKTLVKTVRAILYGLVLLFFIYWLNNYAVRQYHIQDGVVWGVAVVFAITALIIIRAAKYGRRRKSGERNPFSIETKEYAVIKQKHRRAKCDNLLNVIQYDHKNGDRSNNSKSNCQALCPNCHATKTIMHRDGR